jgi:hypothetical protein
MSLQEAVPSDGDIRIANEGCFTVCADCVFVRLVALQPSHVGHAPACLPEQGDSVVSMVAAFLRFISAQEGRREPALRFWQEGAGFDRNLFATAAILALIDSHHANPVRRSLCERATDWPWSSAWYSLGISPRRQHPRPSVRVWPASRLSGLTGQLFLGGVAWCWFCRRGRDPVRTGGASGTRRILRWTGFQRTARGVVGEFNSLTSRRLPAVGPSARSLQRA